MSRLLEFKVVGCLKPKVQSQEGIECRVHS